MIVIYKIISPTGKVYIGQSKNFVQRLRSYKNLCCNKQRKLFNSFVKHGFSSHSIEVIHQLPKDVSQSVLNEYEQLYYILYRNCKVMMLNLSEPGNCVKMSEESRLKLSKSRKGQLLKEETKIKIGNANRGKKRLGITEEHRKNLSNSKIGFKFSEEAKLKMSLAKKGKPSPKKGVPSGKKGVKLTEEHKQNISKARLKNVRINN